MTKKRRVKFEKRIKPRENMFVKRHKIMLGMRWDMNKRTKKGLETSTTKMQQKHGADMFIWGIQEWTVTPKREDVKRKSSKRYRKKRNEHTGEEKLQEKEGRGVLEFVSCLIIPLRSMREKKNSAEGKELNRISEEHRTQNLKDNL